MAMTPHTESEGNNPQEQQRTTACEALPRGADPTVVTGSCLTGTAKHHILAPPASRRKRTITDISSSTRALLALSSLTAVGSAVLKDVAALPAFWEMPLEDLCNAVPQLVKSLHGISPGAAWVDSRSWADRQVALAEINGARILSPLDDGYPPVLAATIDRPFLLFVKGSFFTSPQRSVAVIGTRDPTRHGRLITQRITQFFAEQHWSIVSGLAVGCDSIAHRGALQAGGHTVAVLAHGLQTMVPATHERLAQEILDAGGALISEYPFGRCASRAQFVERDRIQAGMAQGVVMIQSGLDGGSLHAARAALDYRRWLAVPYPTDKDMQRGEAKIQANIVIATGSDARRTALLHCQPSALQLVKILRRREDYFGMIAPGDQELRADVGYILGANPPSLFR